MTYKKYEPIQDIIKHTSQFKDYKFTECYFYSVIIGRPFYYDNLIGLHLGFRVENFLTRDINKLMRHIKNSVDNLSVSERGR